jgi:ABC-type thiamine transport system ATPase subunit
MTRLLLQGAGLGPLRSADLQLTTGRYVVLSNEGESLRSLVALAAGREAPRVGRVLLDGAAPVLAPEARRRIAALFDDEALPPGRSVEVSVARALAARAETKLTAAQVLADAGIDQLAQLAARDLGPRELRSVALALALAHDSATLVVLHEPLTTLIAKQHVLAALERHTARGAIVLTTTSSSADANLLGGSWLCVELGRLQATPTPRLGQGPWQQVLVEAADVRALSLLLHESALGLASELVSPAGQLKVSGPALDDTVREIITLARKHGIELTRLEPALPPVEALLAARAGFARGAYEASRLAARDAPPAPPSYGAGTA